MKPPDLPPVLKSHEPEQSPQSGPFRARASDGQGRGADRGEPWSHARPRLLPVATFETRAREAGEADGAAGNRGWSVGLAEPPREAGEEEEGAVQSGGPGVPPAMRSSPTMQSRVGAGRASSRSGGGQLLSRCALGGGSHGAGRRWPSNGPRGRLRRAPPVSRASKRARRRCEDTSPRALTKPTAASAGPRGSSRKLPAR